MAEGGYHVPVLLEECMARLDCGPGLYVDGTLGGGGHSFELLSRNSGAFLFGIDRDGEAIEAASARLSPFAGRFMAVRGNFGDMPRLLAENGMGKARGILLDLGVSSHQFDCPERGFSFHEDAPLDMRMDRRQSLSAETVVNGYDQKRLARVIADYGEERWAARIASFIVARRPIRTTGELVEAIKAAVPAGARQGGPHPARRTFQALRIEVNGELELLAPALEGAVDMLEPGGHLAVITFHSLEDRIVKQTFARFADPCTCPRDFPVCVCGKRPVAEPVTRKPVTATVEELELNPRSRSAKLRVCRRI